MPSLSSRAITREIQDAEQKGARHERAAIAALVRAAAATRPADRGCTCHYFRAAYDFRGEATSEKIVRHDPRCLAEILAEIESRGAAPKGGEE